LPFELSDVLDDCKAANLRNLEVAGRTVVHLDVSHASHFEGFDRLTGPSAGRIAVRANGVEFDGPDNVQWADRGDDGVFDIRSGAADVLWADQYLERLWPEEMPAFLREVRRLLSSNGLFVLAGVNREVAGDARRPARAVELTWAEAVAVLLAAGFDIVMPKGMLLGLDRAGQPLASNAVPTEAQLEIVSRSIAGVEVPERCSGWWVVVRDSGRPADLERIADLLRHAGAATARKIPEMAGAPGIARRRAAGEVFWEAPAGGPRLVGQSVNVPLRAGRYRATLQVQRTGKAAPAATLGAIEAVAGGAGAVVGRVEIDLADLPTEAWTPVEIEVRLDRSVDDFRLSLSTTGAVPLRLGRKLELSTLFWTPVEGDPVKRRPAPPVKRRSR
jgi:hypothetical protein